MNYTTEDTIMLQIQDTLVSLDLIERYFCCDLDQCLGQCCIDGDAGAPVTEDECRQIAEALPTFVDDLLPAARRRIDECGISYIDEPVPQGVCSASYVLSLMLSPCSGLFP